MRPTTIQLTSDQASIVEQSNGPVRARDPQSREYMIVRCELFEKMQRALDVEQIDRTFYECEDETAAP